MPSVFLGLYTNWFHRYALSIGLVGGLITGTWMVVIQNFASSVYTISLVGLNIPIYAAMGALIVNLALCTILTLLFRIIGIPAGRDATRPADFEANPVLRSPSITLEAQIDQGAYAADNAMKMQESVIKKRSR